MPKPIEELRKVRLEKLEKLRELGINPYPASWDLAERRIKASECADLDLGTEVVVAGRIRAWREHGGITFADLHDDSGKIQLCFREDEFSSRPRKDPSGLGSSTRRVGELVGTIGYAQLDLLTIGDFVGVSGELFRTEAGELTVLVKDLKLLAKSLRPLPSEWYGLKDVEERYRKRYLDLLMNPEVQKVFETRTRILTLLRQYLDEHGFLEVETPILQPIYGGASARPFITHLDALDTDLYLRISDELYLKRLIVGGFEKVYEVSKDFRNEGIDRQHSPEFTAIEFYWAYANYEDLMKFTEEMLSSVIKEIRGDLKVEFEGQELDFTPPWPRVTYRDLVFEHTGIDLNEVKTEEELRKAIEDLVSGEGKELGKEKSQALRPVPEPGSGELPSSSKGSSLDLSGAVGYGAVLDALYKEFCRSKVIQPTFLIDHPAETVALAKRKEEDPAKIARFQLLVSGYEIINAYNELNDPLDQKERWLEQEGLAKKGLEEHEALDEDYIEALEYGMPPTAGWGIGVDRLTAILANQHSLRDVILFPLMRPESGPAEGNP